MPRRRRVMHFFLLAALLVAVLIFFFSAQNGDESSALSDGIAQGPLSFFGLEFTGLSDEVQEICIAIIRKLAHLAEYALLGFNLTGYFRLRFEKHPAWFPLLLALIAGALYAASDEVHQLFVAGRAASAADVGIDGIGVLAGGLLLLLWYAENKSRLD